MNKKNSYISFKEFGDGIFVLRFEELTIAAFLFQLNNLPQSEIRISKPILNNYLDIKYLERKSFSDLNQRLLSI